jgi:hypothetical protein
MRIEKKIVLAGGRALAGQLPVSHQSNTHRGRWQHD